MNDTTIHFTLTGEHVALLRKAYVRWGHCEYGAPSIDCKRPYGNSSVEEDICDILEWEQGLDPDYGDRMPSDEQREAARRIHEETETALQVVLATGSFTPGEYIADKYSHNWLPLPPTP